MHAHLDQCDVFVVFAHDGPARVLGFVAGEKGRGFIRGKTAKPAFYALSDHDSRSGFFYFRFCFFYEFFGEFFVLFGYEGRDVVCKDLNLRFVVEYIEIGLLHDFGQQMLCEGVAPLSFEGGVECFV